MEAEEGPTVAIVSETVEMEYAEAPAEEQIASEEETVEHEPHGQTENAEQPEEQDAPRSSLAQRFAARRQKRGGKSSGGSLRDRLRGLVAESPESRT